MFEVTVNIPFNIKNLLGMGGLRGKMAKAMAMSFALSDLIIETPTALLWDHWIQHPHFMTPQKMWMRDRVVVWWIKLSAFYSDIHKGTGTCPSYFTSDPASY